VPQASRGRWLVLAGLAAAAGCVTQRAVTPLSYPAAPSAAVIDHYHGVAVPDPYRPLEQLDAAATRHWVDAENRLARPWLEALPLRAQLRRQFGSLMRYARRALPVQEGGRSFGLRHDGRQAQSVLYVAADGADAGRPLVDPNKLRRDGTEAIADFVPDPQGRRVAYALADAGSDWKLWRIRDVASGADLPEFIRYTKFTSVSWARDGSGFYYSRYPERPDGSGDDQRQAAIWFHRVGTPQNADRFVYAITDHPTRDPYGEVTEDGRYLIITQSEGTLTSGLVCLPLDRAAAVARPLATDWDGLYTYIGADGDQLYFTTTAGAPNGRVLALDLQHPERARWRSVVPEAPEALAQATLVGGRVFAVYLRDAHSVVRTYREDGEPAGEVALPGLGTVAGFHGHLHDAATLFSYTDYFTPLRILSYDIASGATRMLFAPQLSVPTGDYVTEQVFFASRDGTRIPMFLVHRRELARDGNQPVLLYGYGGFDIALTPAYSPGALAWLELGGLYVVANLRGGGEYGVAWHTAGIRTRKQNVFDDFAAAARYLVAAGYTRPQRIAISGRSNGGLLVAASLTQHPELFGAALPAVGVLDMLRYQTASANARQWSSDYGLSEDPRDFAAQLAYSPLHNLVAGRCYPPTLVTTADHDDRVVPWHSYKFAATLQHDQGCANPVLIRIETRAGHGAGKPLWMQIEDYADQWAFAAHALGIDAQSQPRA
jgi:prolyl oligopeptidase